MIVYLSPIDIGIPTKYLGNHRAASNPKKTELIEEISYIYCGKHLPSHAYSVVPVFQRDEQIKNELKTNQKVDKKSR